MAKVVLDPSMLAALLFLKEPLELCDESGQILAHVTPVAGDKVGGLEVPLSEEELLLIDKELELGKCFTTDEVLAHLLTLETT